jgi:hypothetical protein
MPSKRPLRKQHRLKAPTRSARTEIVAPELLDELLALADTALTAFDGGLRRITAATFAHRLKSGRRSSCAWRILPNCAFDIDGAPSWIRTSTLTGSEPASSAELGYRGIWRMLEGSNPRGVGSPRLTCFRDRRLAARPSIRVVGRVA